MTEIDSNWSNIGGVPEKVQLTVDEHHPQSVHWEIPNSRVEIKPLLPSEIAEVNHVVPPDYHPQTSCG